ncbi:Ig-like domain-containing protein [Flavobacteriaceae bacterium]|nr:Ig-like domain-containing protein [Flavobacteriaceae bacterium]
MIKYYYILYFLNFSLFGQTIISAGAFNAEDVTSPNITISATEGLSGFSSSDATISVTFTVNESTYNFVIGDVTVSNGSLSNFSGTGSLFTATFTPTTDGATSIQVLSNTFSDGVGNANTTSNTFTWTKTSNTETDGDWLKVFSHDCTQGDFFSSSNDWAEARRTNDDDPDANKYSILDTVQNFNLNNKYTFKIVYPDTNVVNIWSQTNNPVNDPNGGVAGYTSISISSNSSGWGGLEQYTPQNSTFLDGTLNPRNNWWWAIGSKNNYDTSVNNFPGPGSTVTKVELWIKYQ